MYISVNPSMEIDTFVLKQKLRIALKDALGDQEIDLIVDDAQTDLGEFVKTIAKQKVILWLGVRHANFIKMKILESNSIKPFMPLMPVPSTCVFLCSLGLAFAKPKALSKLHALLDLRGSIPAFIEITDGKVHDVNILDILATDPGSFYVMDRGYLDFQRLYTLHQTSAFFVLRAKCNMQSRCLYLQPVDKSTGLQCDQTILLTGYYTAKDYPDKLRRIRYYESKTDSHLVFSPTTFSCRH